MTCTFKATGELGKLTELETGSTIRFEYKDTEFQGVVISFTTEKYNIKLLNGYNLSVPVEAFRLIEKTGKVETPPSPVSESAADKGKKKKLALVGTGGTIASRVDYITGAVKPVKDAAFLRESVSNIAKYDLDIHLLEAVLSENLVPEDWVRIAGSAKDALSRNQGAVILHGTDTMSYTATALSFMFPKLSGPIVFAGSQRSPDRPSSDAFINLEAALEFAASGFGEVGISMHENTSDTGISLHRAVRSRKMHTSRRDAFKSVGSVPMGSYSGGKVQLSGAVIPRSDETVLMDKLDENVALVYFHPALSEDDFLRQTEEKRAVVIMGTGLGHAGTRLYPAIRDINARGDYVFMTSQCLYGSTNMNVYSTGRELLSMGVHPLSNMLPEVAMIKAMFLLANHGDDEFLNLMGTNLRGELLERERFEGGF